MLPTLILEPGPVRGLSDMEGLLRALAATAGFNNHKACAFDKPGTGFSDYLRLGQVMDVGGTAEYYGLMLEALAEQEEGYPPPYVLVG